MYVHCETADMEEEKKKKEDQLQAVWFAAGAAALMACLNRAIVANLVEQWRVWVFLALNLLLLAILFTSTCSTTPKEGKQKSNNTSLECRIERKKTRKHRRQLLHNNQCNGEGSKLLRSAGRRNNEITRDDNDMKSTDQLSKEELNERVEAFIAMFRQHLILDSKGRSPIHSPAANGSKIFAKPIVV